jgi:hypothetical protein
MINPLIFSGIFKLLSISSTGTKDTVSVSSTCLSEVSYDLATQTLEVEFVTSGSRYAYFGVPESEFDALVNQFGSVGEEYNDIIKGVYPYARR